MKKNITSLRLDSHILDMIKQHNPNVSDYIREAILRDYANGGYLELLKKEKEIYQKKVEEVDKLLKEYTIILEAYRCGYDNQSKRDEYYQEYCKEIKETDQISFELLCSKIGRLLI